jgi:hypothetical protein
VYDRSQIAQLETSQRKNSVDNECNSPQYLGVGSLFLLQLGNDFESTIPSRENRSRRKLHASKEKGCKEEKETLTVSETILRHRPDKDRKFRKPLERSTSPGVFSLIP